jgi:predicted acylesterase/phospholipase RssA/CRP-like cAMP-binding protein
MFPEDKLAYFSSAPLFQAIDSAALHDLRADMDWLFLAGGETLFCAGDTGDSMYVVLSGRLRIIAERSDGTSETIREIARGESVGELALLTGRPRSATVRAIRDTELVRISQAAFENAIRTHPQMLRRLTAQVADRQSLGTEDTSSRRNLRTIAVLPIDEQSPSVLFTQRLVEVLNRVASALHVKEPSISLSLPESLANPEANSRATTSLNALELDHRFVVYEASSELSSWTAQCIRQADLILIVSAADSAPETSRLEALTHYFACRTITAGIELVLLHTLDFDPAIQTNRWSSLRPLNDQHHVVLEADTDLERLVRILTGTAVGLVLSGGGARGFAHIGVIRALHECGIPIDAIGGTSMGAVIAAQCALGWDWQTMARVNREEWPRCEPQKNYTLPLVALSSGRRMDQMLKKMFGAGEIQNLRTQFFCVSTNLTTADAKIHDEGTLWKAVRASVSIPGIGPPAIENGEILVDGGLVNNLPVDIMKKLCPGIVFAVDVSEQLEFNSKLKESYTLSGWKLLGQRLNPFSNPPDIPSMLNILYRTTTVGGIRFLEAAKSEADYYLDPPVQDFGVFDWRSIDRIIDIGYRYALRKLEDSDAVVRLSRAKPA